MRSVRLLFVTALCSKGPTSECAGSDLQHRSTELPQPHSEPHAAQLCTIWRNAAPGRRALCLSGQMVLRRCHLSQQHDSHPDGLSLWCCSQRSLCLRALCQGPTCPLGAVGSVQSSAPSPRAVLGQVCREPGGEGVSGKCSLQVLHPLCPPPQSKNQPHRRGEYNVYSTFQSHEPEFDYLKSLEIEEKINKIRWLPQQNAAYFLLSTNGACGAGRGGSSVRFVLLMAPVGHFLSSLGEVFVVVLAFLSRGCCVSTRSCAQLSSSVLYSDK